MKLEPWNPVINNLVKKRSFSLKSFNRKLPNQTCSKNLTYTDVMVFHQYIDSKRLNHNVNFEELQKLFHKKGKNFVSEAVSYFMKIYKYPPELRPRVIYTKYVNDFMSFSLIDNTMYINKRKTANMSLKERLIAIRHEFRHFEQSLDVLRCKELKSAPVEFYAKLNIVQEKLNDAYNAHLAAKPNEEFDAISTYWDYLNYYNDHPNDKNLLEKRKIIKKYRQKIIKHLGWIMPKTENSKRAIEMFKETAEQEINPAGLFKKDFLDYQFSYSEYDAFLAQKLFKNQIAENPKCLFSILKQSNKDLLNLSTSNDIFCKDLSKKVKSMNKIYDDLPINFLHCD